MKFLTFIALMSVVVLFAACSPQDISDAEITARIKGKLALDSRTSAMVVKVDTVNGVTTLSGAVPVHEEKLLADEMAWGTRGVRYVINRIHIDPAALGIPTVDETIARDMRRAAVETRRAAAVSARKTDQTIRDAGDSLTDARILTRVKSKLLIEGIIGTNVDVRDGVVILRGLVETQAQIRHAGQIAQATDGVRAVRNDLRVLRRNG
ncbi:MAG: BON domain-containing protein [Blastocatellia bacterium]